MSPTHLNKQLDAYGVPRIGEDAEGDRFLLGVDQRIRLLAVNGAAPRPQAADWIPAGDHFVLIVENDSWNPRNYTWDQYGIPVPLFSESLIGKPITFEHYIGPGTTLENVRKMAKGSRYGRTAIARLVIVEAQQ